MPNRLDLQARLEQIVGEGRAYFQPPPTVKMIYPCIVYEHSNADTKFADNYPYRYERRYQLTVIDADPDSIYIDEIATSLQKCVFDRHFTKDNLNHYVFSIFF